MFGFKKVAMPTPGEALAGRATPIRTANEHFINHHPLKGPYPQGFEKAMSLWNSKDNRFRPSMPCTSS